MARRKPRTRSMTSGPRPMWLSDSYRPSSGVLTSNSNPFIDEFVHTLDALFEWPTSALDVCLGASISPSRHPASAQLWSFQGPFNSGVSQRLAPWSHEKVPRHVHTMWDPCGSASATRKLMPTAMESLVSFRAYPNTKTGPVKCFVQRKIPGIW
jgi:hypothetical protein